MTTKENMVKLLRKIMAANGLNEVDIVEDMQRSVLWYDNAGFPNEDFIEKLTWDGKELGYVLSSPDHVTVYEDDTAFNDEDAMHEVLGSVLMTVGGIPRNIYSNFYDRIEELIVGILENSIAQSSAHQLVMELSSAIVAEKLTMRHIRPLDFFVKADTDDPDCLHYREEFDDEATKCFDEVFGRLCYLFGSGVDDKRMIIWLSMKEKDDRSGKRDISMKDLTETVEQLGADGGGNMEITGTWRGKPRSIWVEQTEWHETPVCLVGGNGHEVSTIRPQDVPGLLYCVLGNYFDCETFSITES